MDHLEDWVEDGEKLVSKKIIVPIRKVWNKWEGITPSYIRLTCLLWAFVKNIFQFYLCIRQNRVLNQKRKLPRHLYGRISPETFEKARLYHKEQNYFDMLCCLYWILWETFTILYVTNTRLWFLSGPVLDWIGIWPEDMDYEMGETVVFIVMSVLLANFVALPLNLLKNFMIEEHYGFNNMSVGSYFLDFLKLNLVGCVWSALTCCIVLQIVREAGRYFFLWLWLFSFIWLMITLAIYPNLIAPFFDKYTPLRHGRLRERLQRLAHFLKFPLDEILVLHQSWKSVHSDIYFYGMLNCKRIVIYDTLLAGYPEADLEEDPRRRAKLSVPKHEDGESMTSIPSRIYQTMQTGSRSRTSTKANVSRSRASVNQQGFTEYEIEAMVAREMGHWVLGHSVTEIIFPICSLFIFFLIFSLLYENSSLYAAFEVPKNSDKPIILGLKLLYMDVMDIYTFGVDAIVRRLRRNRELESDVYAAKLGYGEDLIDAIIELNKENLRYPYYDSWYWANYNAYPAALERIAVIEEEIKKTD